MRQSFKVLFSKAGPKAPANSKGKNSTSLGLLLVGEKKSHTNGQKNLLSSHNSKFNDVERKLLPFEDRL